MGFFRRRAPASQSPDATSTATGPTYSPVPATSAAPESSPTASTQELDQQLPGVALHYQTWGAPNA